jgi:sigma-B regulation protein RsbU (phosphoserine phosphatase)
MLPPPGATVEGIGIAARYVACSELCGDIFDYASAGPGRAAVLVADVSGHGTSAALLTSVVKSAFRSAAVDHYEPGRWQRAWWTASAPSAIAGSSR